jgi:transposase InsO family protein
LPGQTLNVDLLFVPAHHLADVKLPAVSGSSGHLVVERLPEGGQEPDYPGRVFADPNLDYAAAMQAFVQASQPLSGPRQTTNGVEKPSQQAKIRQLHQKEAELGAERRQVRQLRQLEDLAWQANWQAQRGEKPPEAEPAQPKVRAHWGSRKPQIELRRGLRAQRCQQLALRQPADECWRLARQNLREQLTHLPVVTAWIAILLVTDNCTRQCLGLPLFLAGAHVTAEMVVAALRVLLPSDLQFLISDRGVHFTAQVFQQLATETGFIHVVIARHRPQSNGIAERFVRTIKEWLADKAWASNQELLEFLRLFLLEFNDRPHQGLPSPGLSPNEFAKRLALM